jgi:hypothetical protein
VGVTPPPCVVGATGNEGEDVSGVGARPAGAGIAGADGIADDLGDEIGDAAKSAASCAPREMVMTPPHTEQRARTLAAGTLSGSTRKTERHSGHTAFIPSLRSSPRSMGP